MKTSEQKLVVFQRKDIRRKLHGGEWWFVIVDVVVALTGSNDPAQYIRKMRARDLEIAQLFEPRHVSKGAVQIVPSPLPSSLILAVASKNCFLGILKA